MDKNEVCFVLTKLTFYKCQRDSLIRTKNYLLYIIDIWLFFFLFQNYFNDLHSVSGFWAMIGLFKTTRYEWEFLTCEILKTTFFLQQIKCILISPEPQYTRYILEEGFWKFSNMNFYHFRFKFDILIIYWFSFTHQKNWMLITLKYDLSENTCTDIILLADKFNMLFV